MKLKLKLFTVLIIAVLFSGLQSLSPASAADEVNLKEHYGAIIDNLIAKCKFNTSMRHSKSDVVRKAALLSCLKTTFYQNKREELILAMIENNIGIKRHQVEHYLNTQFYDLVRSRKKTIAKAYLGN